MRLDLQLADESPVRAEGALDLTSHEGVREALSLVGPVEAAVTVDRTDRGDYRIVGKFRFRGTVACSRCVAPIDLSHEGEFSLLLLPRREEPTEDEHSLSAGELDVAYYDSVDLDLDPLIAEQVVIAVPMKPLCRDDCRGICPTCGANRNEAPCSCEEEKSDPRWVGLSELKKSLGR